MGKICPSFRLVAILGHQIHDLGHKCGRPYAVIWCSSKIYHSNIVQLEEFVICYEVFQAYLISITEEVLFFAEGKVSARCVVAHIG